MPARACTATGRRGTRSPLCDELGRVCELGEWSIVYLPCAAVSVCLP
jgi:hypothetical protein